MSHSYGLLYHVSFCNQRRKAINAPAALGAHPSVFGRLARGLGQRSAGWRRGQSHPQIKQNSSKTTAILSPAQKTGSWRGKNGEQSQGYASFALGFILPPGTSVKPENSYNSLASLAIMALRIS
jgi:hypothetical protein